MGEIADMMLDGTMDPETGEFNFDGEDGPGFPMTGKQARAWKRGDGPTPPSPGKKARRAKGGKGNVRREAYVCQIPLTHHQFTSLINALADAAGLAGFNGDTQAASHFRDVAAHVTRYAPPEA